MTAPPLLRTLVAHPGAPAAAPCAVETALDAAPGGGLALRFCLRGALARLRIPPARPPGAADELWRHTCFEAFVGVAGDPAYREFNFSPSGQWASYAFRDWRERDPDVAAIPAPRLVLERLPDRLELTALLPLAALPPAPPGAMLQVGLAAVVEEADGVLSYWALRHPAPRPDFHHRAGFALSLDAHAIAPPRQGQP
jgi:hypothetical protein